MKLKLSLISLILCVSTYSTSLHAGKGWDFIISAAGQVAGNLISEFLKPKPNTSTVQRLTMDVNSIERAYNNYDLSNGRPADYNDTGMLIQKLKRMSKSLSGRVDNLENKVSSLEERLSIVENSYTYISKRASNISIDINSVKASFDCEKSTKPVEFTICNTIQIKSIDGHLGKIYHQLRKKLPPSQSTALLNEQRRWIKLRDSRCSHKQHSCLIKQYRIRLRELSGRI